ncbi:DUF4402 domain-containing protein [Erythrobacter sp. JK5]|uniref:DUF4402 domain-containing protein n=1 Tax=Erythrobacter sp. JK5 TaxID=2829500 RepID=UPI001BA61A13|nr:DUF4402 domain-containing protein [Erythrobacter sp. JK5]QUL36740.1 DUF4402 domain-containing protein [Erythrobacter sp. JK5]
MFRRAALIAAAISLAIPAPVPLRAQGACPNCDLPPGCRGNGNQKKPPKNGRNCQRLEITIESDVDFGRLVLLGKGEGRVLLDLDTGEKRLIGDIDDLGGIAVSGRAVISGAPLEEVRIAMPNEVAMRDPTGGRATMRDVVTTLPAMPRLDIDGRLEFRFSGTLVIDAGTDGAGKLRGRVPISVEYP